MATSYSFGRSCRHVSLLFLTVLSLSTASGQSLGDIDTGFNSGDIGNGAGYHLSSITLALAVQPDGRILCAHRGGGSMSLKYSQHFTGAIFRLHPDGTLDDSFSTLGGFGMNTQLSSITVQSDGKLLIAGQGFNNFGGIPCHDLIRLHPDGSFDTTFHSLDPGTRAIVDSETLPDGRILITGSFFTLNGIPHHGVARLMPNGIVDDSFQTVSWASNFNFISAVYPLSDGRMLIGGDLSTTGSYNIGAVARLLENGDLDTLFTPAAITSNNYVIGGVRNIVVLDDERIFVSGFFSRVDSALCRGVTALLPDGQRDTTLDFGTGFRAACCSAPFIRDMVADASGRLYLAGNFTEYRGTDVSGLVRLLPDGNFDPAFHIGPGVNYGFQPRVEAIALASNGGVIAIGDIMTYDELLTRSIVHVLESGEPDPHFDPGTGANSAINTLALQVDGKILAGGDFSHFNGEKRLYLARLNADGTLDPSFLPPDWSKGDVRSLNILNDGRILVGGSFQRVGLSLGGTGLVRLHANGSLDSSFQVFRSSSHSPTIMDIQVQPDGKIIIVGRMSQYFGQERRGIARLFPDGGLDTTFTPPIEGFSEVNLDWINLSGCLNVQTAALQTDGRIIVGGTFDVYGDVNRPRLVRLNADGSLDLSFEATDLVNVNLWCQGVHKVVTEPNGNIVVGGNIGIYEEGNIARLAPNGQIDPLFETNASSGELTAIVKREGGGYLVATSVWPNIDIDLLGPDGELDQTFRTGPSNTGLRGSVEALLMDQNGGLIISGRFLQFDGIGRNNLVRIYPLALTTSVTPHQDGQQVVIHPNPLRDDLLIYDLGTTEFSLIEVYNATGILLRSIPLASRTGQGSVDLNNLTSGSYYVTFRGERISNTSRLTIVR